MPEVREPGAAGLLLQVRLVPWSVNDMVMSREGVESLKKDVALGKRKSDEAKGLLRQAVDLVGECGACHDKMDGILGKIDAFWADIEGSVAQIEKECVG